MTMSGKQRFLTRAGTKRDDDEQGSRGVFMLLNIKLERWRTH